MARIVGIDIPRNKKIGARGYDVFQTAFHDENILIRFTGDTIALSPPLIVEKSHIDQIVESLRNIIPNN